MKRNIFKQLHNEKGQVLLLTILITVIVLTLAVAAARRTTVDIRQLNAATESNRALAAAEAGVEDALLDLKNGSIPVDCGGLSPDECDLNFGGSNLSELDVEVVDIVDLSNVPEEQTVQVILSDDADDYDGDISITWDEGTAIGITIILADNNDPPNYKIYKEAINCGNVGASNGFTVVQDGDDGNTDGKCTITHINIGAIEDLYLPDTYNALLIRVRPLYDSTSITIAGVDDDLPNQGVSVISTGEAGDSERKIEASRIEEALPSIFDFVLFNGSGTNALSDRGDEGGTSWFQFFNGDIHSDAQIDVDLPGSSSLCAPEGTCIFTSSNGISTGSGSVSDEGWQDGNYTVDFPIERFSYDALLSKLSGKVDAVGTDLQSVQGILNTGGIVRLSPSSGNTVTVSTAGYNALTTKPVVVFVGGPVGGADINLQIDVANFINKNVVFVVSRDVIITSNVDRLEAALIFDGLYRVID